MESQICGSINEVALLLKTTLMAALAIFSIEGFQQN